MLGVTATVYAGVAPVTLTENGATTVVAVAEIWVTAVSVIDRKSLYKPAKAHDTEATLVV